jgi:hypothetical protein
MVEPATVAFRPASRGVPDLMSVRDARAVRERSRLVYEWVMQGRSLHFTLDESRLADVAAYVAAVTRESYPTLAIPPHSRWRHFSAGSIDRWGRIAKHIGGDAIERARAAIDLTTVSVLLDSGAGSQWRYREPRTGLVFARSEGLAVASVDMFEAGVFSSNPAQPCLVDGTGLQSAREKLAHGFQAGPENPLIGLEWRGVLLHRLGEAIGDRADLFGAVARPGCLVDYFLQANPNRRVSASVVLKTLLDAFPSIWPSGLVLDGLNFGDAGLHPAIRTGDGTDGIVPFHKLSQWLTYSLIEPLAIAGITMVDLDALTALPEYRNGGLLVDLGLIRLRRPSDFETLHEVSSEFIVEWRALTVILMDRLHGAVRTLLGADSAFMLPHLLQGGTWSAGRKIALARRPPNGPPPISVVSDGTVF